MRSISNISTPKIQRLHPEYTPTNEETGQKGVDKNENIPHKATGSRNDRRSSSKAQIEMINGKDSNSDRSKVKTNRNGDKSAKGGRGGMTEEMITRDQNLFAAVGPSPIIGQADFIRRNGSSLLHGEEKQKESGSTFGHRQARPQLSKGHFVDTQTFGSRTRRDVSADDDDADDMEHHREPRRKMSM